jgi:SurA-like protein
MKRYYLTLIILLFCSFISAKGPDPIVVNNRILAKVNGKTISVIDVMKKLNVLINRHFPHIAESDLLRYQFYSSQWKEALAQMIDQELILADAEKLEVKLNEGDVREKLQERFGPNVVATLEKLELTYDEAREMIRTELIVQKMTWYRINAKAILSINPQDVKVAFKEFCTANPPQDEWKYEALSIRATEPKQAEDLSLKAFALLNQGKAGLLAVADEIKKAQTLPPEISINVSQEYCVLDKDLSASHKNVLMTLNPGDFSKPIPQVSRQDNQIVHRIFHLKEHIKKSGPNFEEMANKIEDELIQKAIGQETEVYIQKLRKRFNYDINEVLEAIPNSFQPFALQGTNES